MPGNEKGLCAPWKSSAASAGGEAASEDVAGAGGAEEDDNNEEAEDAASTTTTLHKKTVYVFREEESLKKRRSKVRGTCSIQQMEHVHLLSNGNLCLPERPRLHYGGANLGNTIGPVVSKHSDWQATVKAKREKIFTKHYRIAVGGSNPGGEATTRRLDSDLESVFFWDTEQKFYDTILNDYFVKSVIDCTPGAGTLATAALRAKTGYLGLCMSEDHMTLLNKLLLKRVAKAMQAENHPLYQPRLAALMAPPKPEKDPKKEPKAAPKTGAKSKAKAAPVVKTETVVAAQEKKPSSTDNEKKGRAAKPRQSAKSANAAAETAKPADDGAVSVASFSDSASDGGVVSDFSLHDNE